MSAAEALQAARAAGIQVAVEGDDLALDAAAPPPKALIDEIRVHKAEIVAALSRTTAAPGILSGLCAPIPRDAPPMPFDATASDFYYHNAQGNWLFAVRRHVDGMGGETSALWTLHRHEVGGLDWRVAPYPAPLPVYNLPMIAANPERRIIITDTEKRADRACIESRGDSIGITAACCLWKETDWTPLRGRKISVVVHDADGVLDILREIGAV